MTKEQTLKDKLGYDWRKLELASVAKDYLKQDLQAGQRDSPMAKKSLEILLGDINSQDPWIVKTLTDPEVMHKTIQNQSETYAECAQDETVSEILEYHKKTFADYVKPNIDNAEEALKPFMKMKYSDIMQEIVTAQHKLEGAKKGVKYSEDELKGAEKVIKKYEPVYTAVSTVKDKYQQDFKNRVKEAYDKDVFAETFAKKEKSKEE